MKISLKWDSACFEKSHPPMFWDPQNFFIPPLMIPTSVISHGTGTGLSLSPDRLLRSTPRGIQMIYGVSHSNLHFRPFLFHPISHALYPLKVRYRLQPTAVQCGSGEKTPPAHLHPQNFSGRITPTPTLPHPVPGHGQGQPGLGGPRHRNAMNAPQVSLRGSFSGFN